MEQSREGAWADAVATAEALLARADVARGDRAKAWSLVASCERRLGHSERADRALREFDALRAALPGDSWAVRVADGARSAATPRLAESSGAAGGARRDGKRGDVPTRLWTLRHQNSIGEHAAAARAAEELLAEGACAPEQVADLWLHLAYARTRLGRDDAAAAADAFVVAARELPADSALPIEMQLLRRSLDLPPLAGLPAAPPPFAPPAEDSYWRLSAPRDAGFADGTADELRALAERSGADGLLVARGGAIVFEHYSPLYREPMHTMSSCKSITGLLAGLLFDRGKLDLDAKVGAFVPEWRDGPRGEATVRHLLTMTSGLPRRPDGHARPGENWTDFASRQVPTAAPGTRWQYSNEGVQLLSPILEHAAGEPLWQFAQRELFAPIGATTTAMRCVEGATNTFADARTTLREFARFGELVRRGGTWPGHGRVVSEQWLERMTAPCERSEGYGMLWWREDDDRGWSMRGYLDTSVWVFPALDAVVARVQQRAYLHARAGFDGGALHDVLRRGLGR